VVSKPQITLFLKGRNLQTKLKRRHPMPKKELKVKPKRRKVIFSLKSPDTKEVILTGDFNGWDAAKHPMKKDNDGIWRKIVMLSPGRYEYKFLVDGKWHYGSYNNYLIIKPK
jgi:1,4-alpha-glucan branching enzyme